MIGISAVYPVCLEIRNKLCVVIGGGEVARRKVVGLLAAGARIRVVSPNLDAELLALAERGDIDWRQKSYSPEDLAKALLVFAATDNRTTQEDIRQQAESNNQLVNVADDPGCCTFHVPACLRRGDLTIAVATNGTSPAVAAMIREQLELTYGPEYEVLLRLMALVRQQVAGTSHSQAQRKNIYKKILHDDIVDWLRRRDYDRLQSHLQSVLGPEMQLDINALTLDFA